MDVTPGRPLNVEVLGISPFNKGALLMLEAIRAQFAQHLPQARLAVPFDWPAEMRYGYNLSCTFPRERGRFDKSMACEWLPRGFRQGVGLLAPSDVDVVLDASGFGYGDVWGLRKLQRRLVPVATGWKSARNTLVLLPQALGSFAQAGMAQAMRQVLATADLVFVRDQASLRHVQALGGPQGAVRSSPDFTPLLQPALPARLAHLRGAALLIPNEKMVGADAARRRSYLAFLALAAHRLAASGRRVLLLVHEAAGDLALAHALNAGLAQPVEILDEPSPLVTKAVIAAADVCVSSRFHGLVSALSSGVPSLACGWTHKYAELMADYGCPAFNIDLSDPQAWPAQLDALIAAAQQGTLRAALLQAAQDQRLQSEAMWRSVFALLHARHGIGVGAGVGTGP